MRALPVALDVSAVPVNPSGVGRYLSGLVAALDRRGHIALSLVVRRGDGARWRALAPGGEVHEIAPVGRVARLVWEQTVEPFLVRRWDVALHHGPHYTMPEVAPVPKVVTIHDLTFFDHPEWHEAAKVRVFSRAIRVAARRADAIVCVSAGTARRLEELLAPDCPVHVVAHGVDHDLFRPDSDEEEDVRRLTALGVSPPYVAFVGTLEPRKDLVTLVHAFDRIAGDLPDLSLVLAGIEGWGTQLLLAAVRASPFAGRIVRTGYVPDGVVPAVLRRAAAVAYPSLEEGFGLPAIEALACGAPVVTTAGSVMAEMTGGAAVLVPPGDAEALAGALARLVEGDSGAGTRRAKGLAVAAAHTWESSAAAHEDVYASVAGTTSRRR